jgi:UDP-N-acetylmuramyl pentapeptide phosphotransferase/UDP-N-acetylglucosamine-1-phosphate transferase
VRTDFVSRPCEDRYNRNVIALGGGIAIFWTIAIFILAGAAIVKFVIEPGHLSFLDESVTQHAAGFMTKINNLLIVLGAVFILHLMGLWDDKKHLGPFVKLAIQFVAAFIAAWFADIRVEMFIESKLITTLLSVFWIVLMINAFNFVADRFLSARWEWSLRAHCWDFFCSTSRPRKSSWVTAVRWSWAFLWRC